MARGTIKEEWEAAGEEEDEGGGREQAVKKGFPSSYGIYLPSPPSGSFGRGPNSDSLCELGRSEVAIFVSRGSSMRIINGVWFVKSIWMGHQSMKSCLNMLQFHVNLFL